MSDTTVASTTLSTELLVEMYRRILRIRHFDNKCIELLRTGRLYGPIHTSLGQEGEVVGACMATRLSDYMAGNHRSHGHPIGKGASLRGLMAEILGKETGVNRGRGGSMHLADFSVGSIGESGIVGQTMAIAAGAALGSKIRRSDEVSLCFFGDGGANTGVFHESLNMASIWRLPVVYVCENNGYAVSTPWASSTAGESIAARGTAYSIPWSIVDGQDAVAVYNAVSAAVETARVGGGPTLIEAKTYRYREHAEFGNMATRLRSYRTEEEMEYWMNRDPVTIHRERLLSDGVLTAETAETIESSVISEVEDAADFAQSSPFPDPAEAFDGVYVGTVDSIKEES